MEKLCKNGSKIQASTARIIEGAPLLYLIASTTFCQQDLVVLEPRNSRQESSPKAPTVKL